MFVMVVQMPIVVYFMIRSSQFLHHITNLITSGEARIFMMDAQMLDVFFRCRHQLRVYFNVDINCGVIFFSVGVVKSNYDINSLDNSRDLCLYGL